MTALAQEVQEEVSPTGDEALRTASQLPEPKGYKLLIALPEVEETTEGGIIKSYKSQH